MTPKSIRSHLAPYSIFSKRRTTVAHAFASALAPSEEFDNEKVEAALNALGQKNLQALTCIYCGKSAQTWDHLENLVREGKLNGYGHQIGNLVPCCRDCNSEKGGKSFRDYVSTLSLSPIEQADLIACLEKHLSLAAPIDISTLDSEDKDALDKFNAIQLKILRLMEEADALA
ncbi:MAG: HNH endonuclease [Rhodocyclales bacterium]|nr:HNH endonuclease [Rhodocyclales bacterium]